MPRRLRLSAPGLALLLGVIGLVLVAALPVLAVLTRNPQGGRDGAGILVVLAGGAVGTVVAWRRPRNPEGWLMVGCAIGFALMQDAGQYAVLGYRTHHGGLPLGVAAVVLKGVLAPLLILLVGLTVLLFPDGKLSRRWTWVLRVYLVLLAVLCVGVVAGQVGSIVGHPIRVDVNGKYVGPGTATGIPGWLAVASIALFPAALFWPAFVGRQVHVWRRATAAHRQQAKWLLFGSVLAVSGLALMAFGPNPHQVLGRIGRDVAVLTLAAVPAGMGVAILRYRLYDIDRLISRTISYTALTGLLVGLYVGLVALCTRVLPFSSPVAVAASTLAAAALFNPLRLRLQRGVDRRFNRARYSAEATAAAFGERLRAAVDLDTVRQDLTAVVHTTLEPQHVSLWLTGQPLTRSQR